VRIIVIIISGLRRKDRDFVNEFHARGIRERTWGRWLFGRMNRRVKGRREGINGGGESGNILEVSAEWGEIEFYQRGYRGTW